MQRFARKPHECRVLLVPLLLILAGSPAGALVRLDGPRVHTVELEVVLEANSQSSATVNLPLPDSISLDGIAMVYTEAIVLTTIVSGGQSGNPSSSAELSFLAAGRRVGTFASTTDSLLSGTPAGDWPLVYRRADALSSRTVVDGVRVEVRSLGPNRARLEGIHSGEKLGAFRLHFVSLGTPAGGAHSQVPVPESARILLDGGGESDWQEHEFQPPVPLRDVRLVYHSGFSVFGQDVLFSGAHSVMEMLLSDGGTLPLDDTFAPTLNALRNRGYCLDNSLLLSEAQREQFAADEVTVVGWRWKLQATGRRVGYAAQGSAFHFLRDFDDCDRNDVPDSDDRLSVADCNANGVLDACEVDCNRNGVPDDCDLAGGSSTDCDQNAIPDECDVVAPLAVELAGPVEVPSGPLPEAVASADFDGDGRTDLAVSDRESESVAVFLQGSEGGFTPSVDPLPVARPRSLVAGDVDGDGDADLVSVGLEGVAVFLNGGEARSFDSVSAALEGSPIDGALGDIDGDGDLDLAVADRGGDAVSILRNDGAGLFALETSYPAGDQPTGVELADIDGDGDLDWVCVSSNARGDDVAVGRNDGGGTFAVDETISLGYRPAANAFLVGDFFAPGGAPELATLDTASDRIVFRELGVESPQESVLLLDYLPAALAAGDFNGDGFLDFAGAEGATGSVSVYLADGPGFAPPAVAFDGGNLRAIIAPDLDGNGTADIVALDMSEHRVLAYRTSTPPAASPDCNHNGVPDACDVLDGVLSDADANGVFDACEAVAARFRRSDANDDGTTDIADAVSTLGHLFTGGPAPACADAADANDDGTADLSDAVFTLGFLFLGGPQPAAPFGECGEDATADDVECGESTPHCAD